MRFSWLWSNAAVSSKVTHVRRCVHGVRRTDNSVHKTNVGEFWNMLERGKKWDMDGDRERRGEERRGEEGSGREKWGGYGKGDEMRVEEDEKKKEKE